MLIQKEIEAIEISKRQKQIGKLLFVAVIVAAIIYTFRDLAGAIAEQLAKTTPAVIAGICVLTTIYHVIEGTIITILAKRYNGGFTVGKGIVNAFFCSFYRVATLGSGAGVAAIVYLGEHGVEYSKSFGLYTLQYAFHKISIAFFSVILLLLNWDYMYSRFADYIEILLAGYLLTLVITLGLVLVCCSEKLHRILFRFAGFVNEKLDGKFDEPLAMLREQCRMLEVSAREILHRKRLAAAVVGLDLLKFCMWYAIPYLVFRAQSDITVSQTMAVTSLSVMLAAVLPSPAGIGSTEFVFTALFSGIVGTGLAGSASLLYRFGTFVFPFLVGAVVVVVRRRRSGKYSENRE